MSAKRKDKTENPPAAKGIRVFVYGTLKRLHYNHELIESKNVTDSVFLGRCYIEGAFRMRDLNWYPGVQYVADPKVKNRIYGEVYRISEDTLKALDIMEGNGNFFTRGQVDTPWKKAWCYMIPASYYDRPIIETGAWKPNGDEKSFIESGKPVLDAADIFGAAKII